ncbi:glycosyl hydrolases family 16 domain-containing protein [Sarocladium implicatum]|nr:glycosyl hydrolases family 16 domain-containing protein [Sarocladium implicatum]
MFSKVLSSAAVALAASTMVSAQTFTECNPIEKDCKPDPAFGNTKVNCDFTKGPCNAFHELDGTKLEYTDKGAVFKIEKESNAPTIATENYMFFGRLEVELQPAPGKGVVTSVVLQSDVLDEIDWEWVGGDVDQVQTNYFSKGDTSTYDRGAYHPVPGAIGSSHTYTIEWTSEKIDWIVNGAVVRTLKASDAKGGKAFPQTPMEVKLGTWVAGRKDAPDGTVEWAGGYTDFTKAPFNAYYKSVKIVDYAGGDSPASGSVRQYVYGDKTGDWESIEVVKGDGPADGQGDDEETSTTKSSKPTNSVIEPEEPKTTSHSSTSERIYTKPKTTIEPSTPVPSTVITPTSTSKEAPEATSSGSSSDEETTTSSGDSSEETGADQVDEDGAAGSVRVALGSLAVAGVIAFAQLL